jgi:hypothetical protein
MNINNRVLKEECRIEEEAEKKRKAEREEKDKERIAKYPRAYNRLMTMRGVTEEERAQCIRDFLDYDEVCNLTDTLELSNILVWEQTRSGDLYWQGICRKVFVFETEFNEKVKAKQENYPIVFNMLSNMKGISEEEREQCLEDFYEYDGYINEVGGIAGFALWAHLKSGADFWDDIDTKVTKKA